MTKEISRAQKLEMLELAHKKHGYAITPCGRIKMILDNKSFTPTETGKTMFWFNVGKTTKTVTM